MKWIKKPLLHLPYGILLYKYANPETNTCAASLEKRNTLAQYPQYLDNTPNILFNIAFCLWDVDANTNIQGSLLYRRAKNYWQHTTMYVVTGGFKLDLYHM